MPNPSKLHPNLVERMQVRALADAASLRVIVLRRAGTVGVAANALEGLTETHYTYRLIPASAQSATVAAIHALTERDEIEMIWYDEPVHALLDVSVPLIGAPRVWEGGFTGKGIKVAIVDTGIDPNHPDFTGRIAQMKDFTGEGPADNHGHGSHVASIVGGTGAGSAGKYQGVAPECVLYAAKVLRGDGSGSTSDVMAGIEWAVQQNVQVVNMSLGSDGACDGTDALSVLCDTAMSRGVVMCIAAGNAGPGASTVGSPGCAKTVITVGASSDTDSVANFSSRGPTSDGRVKPDVCFPGVSIVAARAAGTAMGSPVDALYTSASGTSMATPHAAGTCALLLQAKPGLSPQQIKDILMTTTKDLELDPNIQGTGRAQIFEAYQKAVGETPTPSPTPVPTPTPTPGSGCWTMLKNVLGGR